MSFGTIYEVSNFGNTNETNGWGSIYPFDADGFFLDSRYNKRIGR